MVNIDGMLHRADGLLGILLIKIYRRSTMDQGCAEY
jgi:hypothetical protein